VSNHKGNGQRISAEEKNRAIIDSNEKSKKNEGKTAEAANMLMARCPIITAVIPAQKLGDLDSNHVDVLLRLNSSLAFLVQVKSSDVAVRNHRRLYPDVYAINADGLNPEEISYELERALKRALAEPDKRPLRQQ